jgi:hypothetical protein
LRVPASRDRRKAETFHPLQRPTIAGQLRLQQIMSQFAVAAVSDRRNLWIQKPAVRDRRYNKSN